MKIPLDFFLRLVHKMMSDLGFDDIAKKINKHFETPEEDYNDILCDVSIKEMIIEYINNNKILKKKIKEKVKKLTEETDEEETELLKKKKNRKNSKVSLNEEEEDKIIKTNKKNRKNSKNSLNEDEEEEKVIKTNKKNRKNSKISLNEDEEEEKVIKTKKKNRKNSKISLNEDEEENEEKNSKKKKNKNSNISEEKPKKKRKNTEESIDLEKEVKFIPKPKAESNPERKPFKRIDDDSITNNIKIKDNSYEAFMKKTGDKFGKAANDKLIVTRGKDFRKEKNKFKNKTFHGGFTISQNVRSTKLYNDSDSD